ncbi:hypothetical protein [Haloplasma contractile]|uniref:Gcn5-related N-acetyltransferase domain protein n=1 Tax=Haloplasma contractile SSD-17B TaxID=1033810 RepID=U2EEX2_9MOLU|nr:hypothetical protein [Haloplasma contractile]ERJ13241.1 Gcn5-related N-acetyltransferase domain protein [Haloplasma contractile SSD-17B]
MLRKLRPNEIDEASHLAYSLSKSSITNSYPLRDSQEEFFKRYKRSLYEPDDEILGYFIANDLIAVTYLNVLKKESYISTNGFFIKSNIETVITEFLKYLRENYSGYEINIGLTKENKVSINSLLGHGFEIIGSDIDQRLEIEDFKPSQMKNKIVKIDETNYEDFATFHDYYAGDIYWNSSRIKEVMDKWLIYAFYSENKIKASIAAKLNVKTELEIYALLIDEDLEGTDVESDLITATIKEGFEKGELEDVVFFIESNDHNARAYSEKLGFKVYSNYICLEIKL